MDLQNVKKLLLGFFVGAVNMILGSGGGIIAVPLLKNLGMTQKAAQANALAIIFPITLLSLWFYADRGFVRPENILPLIPPAVAGALTGALVFKKFSDKRMAVVFSGFMIWAGIRLLQR